MDFYTGSQIIITISKALLVILLITNIIMFFINYDYDNLRYLQPIVMSITTLFMIQMLQFLVNKIIREKEGIEPQPLPSLNLDFITPGKIFMVIGILISLIFIGALVYFIYKKKNPYTTPYNYIAHLEKSFSINQIELASLNYTFSKEDKSFLLKNVPEKNISKKWYESNSNSYNGSCELCKTKDYNALYFCSQICDILSHKNEIIEYLTKNNNEKYINLDYIEIKKNNLFFNTELTFYILLTKDLNIVQLYEYYKQKNRLNLLKCIANPIKKEIEFQKKLSTNDDIDEAISLFKLNNMYDVPEVVIKNILYLSNNEECDNKYYKKYDIFNEFEILEKSHSYV